MSPITSTNKTAAAALAERGSRVQSSSKHRFAAALLSRETASVIDGARTRKRRHIIPGHTVAVGAHHQQLVVGVEFQHSNAGGNKEVAVPINCHPIGPANTYHQSVWQSCRFSGQVPESYRLRPHPACCGDYHRPGHRCHFVCRTF